ncbi:solute carrier family 35 member B1 isoform X2 [Ahaetulla prasina]|uniref:solute carrier family 35 member B1 isoform X2 n=1 Tax=Ahaetulla prasina TaxID=499056 RepID=UPI00264A0251|nr:solute carrier family 35 member B1 isoform X2 [Ahaetulla prasina]
MRPSFPPPSLPVRDECVELSPLRVSVPETTALSAMGATGGSGGGGIWFFSERLRLPLCCLGVFVCYFWYGVLQETITRGKYGEGAKQEKFRYALSLVFIQCVMNAIFAKLSGPDSELALRSLFSLISRSNGVQQLSTSVCQLPNSVMLLGVTVLKKKYPLSKYLCVLLIVTGVALFMYKPKNVGSVGDEHVFGYGELLLLLSLTLDGLTGVSQDHMRAYYQTGSNHMMLNVNLWSTLVLGAGIFFTGELWEFLSFTERYPTIIYNILLFGLTSALGQTFIFMTVVYFGPLTCSIVTTTRKFFTILASVILFANPISNLQWMGTILVFLGKSPDSFVFIIWEMSTLVPMYDFLQNRNLVSYFTGLLASLKCRGFISLT